MNRLLMFADANRTKEYDTKYTKSNLELVMYMTTIRFEKGVLLTVNYSVHLNASSSFNAT